MTPATPGDSDDDGGSDCDEEHAHGIDHAAAGGGAAVLGSGGRAPAGARARIDLCKVLSHYDFTAEQDQEFRAHRKVFTGAMIEAMQVIRDLVREQYNGK